MKIEDAKARYKDRELYYSEMEKQNAGPKLARIMEAVSFKIDGAGKFLRVNECDINPTVAELLRNDGFKCHKCVGDWIVYGWVDGWHPSWAEINPFNMAVPKDVMIPLE